MSKILQKIVWKSKKLAQLEKISTDGVPRVSGVFHLCAGAPAGSLHPPGPGLSLLVLHLCTYIRGLQSPGWWLLMFLLINLLLFLLICLLLLIHLPLPLLLPLLLHSPTSIRIFLTLHLSNFGGQPVCLFDLSRDCLLHHQYDQVVIISMTR